MSHLLPGLLPPSLFLIKIRSYSFYFFIFLIYISFVNINNDFLCFFSGWAAVIANLEDVTADFKNRSDSFESNYKQYLDTRQDFLDMLDRLVV